jgi:YjbE family integral membrane protein
MPNWLPILGGIILVDLVLSGDNALVIGAVAAGIPVNLRWIAFIVGGGGAILLRILLTYSVTLLLGIPYIEVLGGIILVIITIRLLLQRDDGNGTSTSEETKETKESNHKKEKQPFLKKNKIGGAILTIIIADAAMSLDNVIAVAALAKRETLLLIIGLIISIILLLVGSALISFIIERFRWIMWVVAGVLAFTAANMIVNTKDIFNILPNEQPWWSTLVYIAVFATIGALTIFYPGFRWLRKRRSNHEEGVAGKKTGS